MCLSRNIPRRITLSGGFCAANTPAARPALAARRAAFERLRSGPFEGPATESLRLCRRIVTVVITVIPLAVAACHLASAQQPPTTTLTIDLGNSVEYQGDFYDPSKYAKNPSTTTSAGPGEFGVATLIGDIVAVNGQPAKGLYAGRSRVVSTSPTPTNGQAIADVARTAIREHILEILQPDGTPIGTIMAMGFSGGVPPPGQPTAERANWAIVGGTGAFLGARGQAEGGTGGVGGRAASMAEDPANRCINGVDRARSSCTLSR